MHQVKGSIQGKEIILETGHLAKQANGSVVLRCGETVLLATATMAKEPREGADFFPLTVEFVEKYYAAGKFAGGYIKREARPSKNATLISRLIDRPLRPSFPNHFFNEVQIIITLLSLDDSFPLEHLAIVASSAAVAVSDIPMTNLVGASLIGDINGDLKVNPNHEEMAESCLDMVVAGTKDAVLMIESGSKELPEDRIIDAITTGHEALKETIRLQEELAEKVSKEKYVIPTPEDLSDLESDITKFIGNRVFENLKDGNKQQVDEFLTQLADDVAAEFESDDVDEMEKVTAVFQKVKKKQIRQSIIEQKVRPDGRQTDEIRNIDVSVDLLPAVHGSSVFTRGETQSLGVITLGTDGDEQNSDAFGEQVSESFYFHYNFPPYSVGECGFLRTGRRELGHGQLAQRALEPVIPSKEDFPYVIRLVSEILESNGSSSRASVCSGSLCLMSSGVPIKAQVSGIAMGLLMDENGQYTILSDIQGLEDHYGDMDFKVAGTSKGITALQLDIKIEGLSREILVDALRQARDGRFHILDKMNKVIDAPRSTVTDRAPKVDTIMINPDKVGVLIGPGGKQIKKIEEETKAVVYVVDGDKGEVSISGKNSDIINLAKKVIQDLVKDVEKGEVYDGKVVKIMNFGAFVELLPGKEALLHISKIAKERVEKVEDYFTVGDPVKVKVMEIDRQGRVNVARVLD
ncbi:MAG: polyribonucleotide nucleotidyltransferase [Candidatus Margulisiibacteriota bacterium]|nr:polyribonucleotide nucleotidyltransferase [Candidatus Margulisiibacteriota bacterium]